MGFYPLGTLLVLMCSTSGSVATGFGSLECNSDNHGRVGHQSLLDCTVSLSEEEQNTSIQIMEVFWMKEGAEMLLQYNASVEQQLEPRFTFAEPHWKDTMNVSMLVTETKIADIGNYRCIVITNSGQQSTSTSLSVSGPYRAPIISSVMEDKRVTSLSCNASGGYPKGTIHWFDENRKRLTPRHEQDAIRTGDGLFNLTSTLDRSLDSAFYICVVNGTGGQEGEARYPPAEFIRAVQQTTNLASKVLPPVLSVLLVIGLLVFIKRRCSQTTHEEIAVDDLDNGDLNQPMAEGSLQPDVP